MRVFMENGQQSQSGVISSTMRGEISTLWYLCHDGLTVCGTHLRRVRDVDMKRDFAFVVCAVFYPPSKN